MSQAHIRAMRAEDVESVIAIAHSLPAAPQWPAPAYQAALESATRTEPGLRRIALVAESTETGIVTGFAIASLLPPQAELETIAVAPQHQRRGLARQLLAALLAELRQSGARELLLEVRASNHPALALYRAMGCAETGRRPRYYAHPVEDAVLMTLPLAADPSHPAL